MSDLVTEQFYVQSDKDQRNYFTGELSADITAAERREAAAAAAENRIICKMLFLVEHDRPCTESKFVVITPLDLGAKSG